MRVRFWGTSHMWPWCCVWLVVFGAWAAEPVDPVGWGFDPGAAPEVNAAAPGEVAQDAEGLQTMRLLGRNLAWMAKNLKTGVPAREPWQMVNFIR